MWGIGSGAHQGLWQSTSSQRHPVVDADLDHRHGRVQPVLAMNANGAAIVAWDEQITGSNHQAAASVRTAPGAPWSAPTVMRAADDRATALRRSRWPATATRSSAGSRPTGPIHPTTLNSIWVRQFTAGSGAGWNAAGLFETYLDQGAYDVNVAANNNGDAIVTYIQVSNTNPATIQLWARRYSVTTNSFATNPSKVFEAGTIDTIVPPSVALDDAGNATVAFAVPTTTGYQVQVSRTAPPIRTGRRSRPRWRPTTSRRRTTPPTSTSLT